MWIRVPYFGYKFVVRACLRALLSRTRARAVTGEHFSALCHRWHRIDLLLKVIHMEEHSILHSHSILCSASWSLLLLLRLSNISFDCLIWHGWSYCHCFSCRDCLLDEMHCWWKPFKWGSEDDKKEMQARRKCWLACYEISWDRTSERASERARHRIVHAIAIKFKVNHSETVKFWIVWIYEHFCLSAGWF